MGRKKTKTENVILENESVPNTNPQTESVSEDAQFVLGKLKVMVFGIHFSQDEFDKLTRGEKNELMFYANNWQEELVKITKGEISTLATGKEIPNWIKPFDKPKQEQIDTAIERADVIFEKTIDPGMRLGLCPYLKNSELFLVFDNQMAILREKKANEIKEARKKEAIENFQAEMEYACSEQSRLENVVENLKYEMKIAKAEFDSACQRGREASRKLADARRGVFEQTLPFGPIDDTEKTDSPPTQIFPITILGKKSLQEMTGCDSKLGLTANQIEKIIESCGGNNLCDLEKWMRENRDWMKEIKGFGEEKINLLLDSITVFRRKFPVDSEPGIVNTDVEEAILKLKTIDEMCYLGLADCDVEEGEDFLNSVRSEAKEMNTWIQEHQAVTEPQKMTIENWRNGIQIWIDSSDSVESNDAIFDENEDE